ncbi:FAD-dependent monooxygenase [Paenibacillus athensensis]|uniref:Flavin-dependent monooxygenase n=1 Tax=Paenibacillus athensensis TaxID=1967502 RepID=A0A4Y8PPI4_9BACL|nr:NAD(P)/FAD-dependent oxidoreductase [Paenibacillus athensensis]MCD1258021.1 FAD-dependent monooxygenase [Paenibacillus athensensis]
MTKNEQQPRIVIVGAGPGGLTLARILQRHGVQAVVYEREATPTARRQGGSLDIHHDSGQLALEAAGLLEQFRAIARYEGEDFRVFDERGKLYLDEIADAGAGGGQRPEIDRGVLRQLLLDAVDPASVHWGCELLEATPLADGRYELRFADGLTDMADLVVAADGAFSRLRSLVTDVTPVYTGLSMIEMYVDEVTTAFPALAAFNRRGKMFALGEGKGILGQLNGDGRLCVYASFPAEREWIDTCGIPFDRTEEAKLRLLEQFPGWAEELTDYIRCAGGPIVPRRIYMLPLGFRWQHRRGVTLIGDAAHLMSPFAGEGVNLAMKDAAELALAILSHDNFDAATAAYEEKMFVYAAESAEQSDANLRLMFTEHAAAALSELMLSFEQI